MSKPNVLMVVFDTARADALEPFGAAPGATPAIADLGRRGTAFADAYATCSWTLPSHASMFSGLLPRRLNLAQPPDGTMTSVRPQLEAVRSWLLPVVLGEHGYATRGLVTNHWVSKYVGFDIGFDAFELVDSGRTQRMEALVAGGRRSEVAWALEGVRSRDDDGAREVGRRLRESIDAWSGQPTFWFVNLTECHSPYLPPRPWDDLGLLDRARAALDNQRHLSFLAICLYVAGHHHVSEEAFGRLRHLYHRAVSYMDAWLADVLGALERKGILDDTLVILTSDHGENFGEDGLIAHGFSLDQRLINVPLVMAGPGTPDARLISLAELPRVIADAAGITDAPWSAADLPSGVAVAQYDPMAPIDSPKIREFARTSELSDDDLEPVCATFTAATDGALKLTVRDGVERFHDLRADPDQRHALPHDAVGAEAAAALREALAGLAAPTAAAPAATAAGDGAPDPDEVAAIERQMKLLGYL